MSDEIAETVETAEPVAETAPVESFEEASLPDPVTDDDTDDIPVYEPSSEDPAPAIAEGEDDPVFIDAVAEADAAWEAGAETRKAAAEYDEYHQGEIAKARAAELETAAAEFE